MSLYYCLAETVVKGEVKIQGVSTTYSASASAFDSSNVSFKDASKVAIVDSNIAATKAARKTVDKILVQYAYVLADVHITEMINNSLKTTIHPIIPILLDTIASTVDGKNYVLNKNTIIKKYQYLLILPGKHLIVDVGKYKFVNHGIIKLQGDVTPTQVSQASSSILKSTSTTCAAGSNNQCCVSGKCSTGLTIINSTNNQDGLSPWNDGSYTISENCCLELDGVTLFNSGLMINYGCIQLLNSIYETYTYNGNVGCLQNGSGSNFYSNPTGTY